MTPDEMHTRRDDDHLLAEVMACDALLHTSSTFQDRGSAGSPRTTEATARGRSRLLLLLTMLDAAESVASQLAVAGADPARDARDENPPLLGRFEVLDDLGSGGFGFVVRARDRLLGRVVALKMPLPERALAPGDVHRFLREARAAARLDHPNIVRVHDAGELGPLGYFIASEFCEGPSLRRWLKDQNEPVPTRLAAHWVGALADAVQHAHDRGIVHRDIKPDNVILAVTSGPDDFIPRLTDFGLAKLVEEAGDETRSEARMGTPHYMAPEQAAGRRRDIGPATDVYALGATLYELITGRPPFRGETDTETLRLVLEAEPVTLRSLRPGLPRDVEIICLKCLRKEPARRYASARALRDDLQRFLDGRPILGRPVSAWERAQGCARRRPAVAALLGLVVFMACGLIGGIAAWASWLRWHTRQLEIQVARTDEQAREAAKHAGIAEDHRRLAERHHYAESLRLARRSLDARQIELAQDILHDIQPEPGGHDPRGFAWRYLWRQAHREFSQLWGHEATVAGFAFSPEGKGLATHDLRGKVLVWNLTPGMELDKPRVIRSLSHAESTPLWFSSDGRSIATMDQEPSSRSINVFDFASGQRVARLDCDNVAWVGGVYFEAGTRRLALLAARPDRGRFVQSWNLSDGRPDRHSWPIEDGTTFCELPANGRFLAVTRAGRTRLLDPWTGERRVEFVESDLSPCAARGLFSFSADGRIFAAHTQANGIMLWDTCSGRELSRCELQRDICRIVLSPKGSQLAMLSPAGHLSVFDRSSKRSQVLTSGSGSHLKFHSLSFSSDETLLAVGHEFAPGGPQPPEVWDIAAARRLGVFPGRNLAPAVDFVPGTRSLIIMGGTRPRIWRLDPSSEPSAVAGHTAEAWAAAFSPDGKILATGSDDTNERQTIKLWEKATGRLLAGWKAHTATVTALAFSPDGRVLASGSLNSGKPGNANVILWNAASQQRLATFEGHTDRVRSIAFSPDGRWLASACDDLTGRLWDVAGRKTRFVLTGHTKNLTSVAFSRDGLLLASASNDATVRIWDVATGQALAMLRDVGNTLAVAFAPDGSLLASVNEEGAIKLWDPTGGQLIRTIRGESEQLRCLAFTPDGRNVVAAGKGKVVRIWDISTGQELLSLEGHQAPINALAFSPDGSILASCSHDGNVKLWRADWPGLALAP